MTSIPFFLCLAQTFEKREKKVSLDLFGLGFAGVIRSKFVTCAAAFIYYLSEFALNDQS